MSADMLDRLQEKKLSGLEELIDSWDDGSAAGGGEVQAAAVADFLVDEAIGIRQRALHHWDYNWALALAGTVADRRERGSELRSLLERGGRLLRRYVAAARHYADLSGREVARLAQVEEQAKAFPLWVAECLARWEMLDRPRKPLNRERIAKAQDAYARGEGEPVSEVIARLEQGGPLVKEQAMRKLIVWPEISRRIGHCGLTHEALPLLLNRLRHELEDRYESYRGLRDDEEPRFFRFLMTLADGDSMHEFEFVIDDSTSPDHLFIEDFEHESRHF